MSRKQLALLVLIGLAGTTASYLFSAWMRETSYDISITSADVVVAHSGDEAFVLASQRRDAVIGQRTELALIRFTRIPHSSRCLSEEITVVHVRGSSRTRQVMSGMDINGSWVVVDGRFYWHRADGTHWWRWEESAFIEVDQAPKLKPGGDSANREGWTEVRQPQGHGAAEVRIPLQTQPFTLRCDGTNHLTVVLHPDQGQDEVLLDLKTGQQPATEAEIREIKVMTAGR
jgi:hypothetical protein